MYISGVKHRVEWVDDLVRAHAPEGWTCDLYLPKRGKMRTGVYGHADMREKRIEICVSDLTQTPENLWIVLHEIAHAIHEASPTYAEPEIVRGRSRRGSIHPPEFWDIAIVLYEIHAVMSVAVRKEYKIGIKRIKAHRAYAARMQAAVNLVTSLSHGAYSLA